MFCVVSKKKVLYGVQEIETKKKPWILSKSLANVVAGSNWSRASYPEVVSSPDND